MEDLKKDAKNTVTDRGDGTAARPDESLPTGPHLRRAMRTRSLRLVQASQREEQLAAKRADQLESKVDAYDRPRTRGECAGGSRPRPFVSCSHHLYIDVNNVTGTIKLNFPDLEVWELAASCALDIADEGGADLNEIGELLNVSRERVRQIEAGAFRKIDNCKNRARFDR